MKMRLILLAAIMLLAGNVSQAAYKSVTIGSIKPVNSQGRALHDGDTVIIQGIAQSPNLLPAGGGPGGGGILFSLADTSGSIMIFITSRTYSRGKPAIGDEYKVKGIVHQYTNSYGFPRTTDSTGWLSVTVAGKTDSIGLVSQANAVNASKIITKYKEKYESEIVQLDSVRLKNLKSWVPNTSFTSSSTGFALVVVQNAAKDSFVLRIPNSIVMTLVAPNGLFTVRGIMSQWDRKAPFTSEYQLIPRDTSDFTILTSTPTPITKIVDSKYTDPITGAEDSAGVYKVLRGIVQSPNFTSTGLSFSIFDNTGNIEVSLPNGNFGYTPTVGDSVEVKGDIVQINTQGFGFPQSTGWTNIIIKDLKILNYNNAVKAPLKVTALDEKNESNLVKLTTYTLKNPAQWDTASKNPKNPKTSITVSIQNAKGDSASLLILKQDSSAWFKPTPTGYFDVIGIEGQADTKAPLLQNYYLIARTYHDIIPVKVYPPLLSIVQVRGNDINGASNAAASKTACYLQGMVYSGNLNPAGGTSFSIEDKTGAIVVFSNTPITGYNPSIGDSVRVRGTIVQSFGMLFIQQDSVGIINHTGTPVKANVISSITEGDEAYHRQLTNLRMNTPSEWDTTLAANKYGFFIHLTDTVNSTPFLAYISHSNDMYKRTRPSSAFNLTGIIAQRDSTSPYTDNYYIIPRAYYDLEVINGVGIFEAGSVHQSIKLYPNPASEKVYFDITAASTESLNLNLYNAAGQLIRALSPGSTNSISAIDLSELPKGMYILRAISRSGAINASSTFIRE